MSSLFHFLLTKKSYDPKHLPEPKVWKFEYLEHVYFDDVPGLFDSPSQRSKSFEEIRKIIGGSNKKDLFHYETA